MNPCLKVSHSSSCEAIGARRRVGAPNTFRQSGEPPYNTGAKDWKYNNDYVDGEDLYRHSKWLAFMERRLLLARELLNPEDSVLVVAIDEKEYLRLGLLLAQTFPDATIQMVSSVINRAGSARTGRFARVDEYIFYVFMGSSQIQPWTSTMLEDDTSPSEAAMPTVWFTATRRGTASAERAARPGLFYPVVIHKATGALTRVGDALHPDEQRESLELGPDELAIWPLARDGREQTWRFSAQRMREYFAAGTARLGKRDPETGLRPITYLQPGTIANIENGTFEVTGRSVEGALELRLASGAAKVVVPRTVWNRTSHFARDHGSHLLKALLGEKRFDFPKSLYAVEDALRFVLAGAPDALVLDFFSGSGTTAHAVMRLNKQDGGHRRSISVTNNEVSADEQVILRSRGLRPGDHAWEALGICNHVTKPRLEAAVSGRTPKGQEIRGEYRFTDEFPMSDGFEENVEFFTLTYETPWRVARHRAFETVAPLLWLRAGARGRRIDAVSEQGWDVADVYGILVNLDRAKAFAREVAAAESVGVVFVVTDDDRRFQMVCGELPDTVEVVRLYESYLRNFEINSGRA
ncbi:MAG: DNA methyltransferase [Candidatus Saccharimonadales bacterium]